ncbi:helix-turn-helix transcriptional regulator [Nocardiopsis tropica]|uniref:Helix-turn-helix transcriptional regulator n=1 Tax=Nocardiopsis tropica TaxID=109330 RepID=A0ABU7KMH3_9ACTN|nr:helix-turn-helix transcriptional regulator [Nocardiopsis umidischolae]MEE2050332.1 helix-turn-helix transcriptional regulator [Nocardiopsis umidischolae]
MSRRRYPHPIITQLRAIRDDAGYTRKSFATEHGFPVSTLEKWDWALASPTLDALMRYAAALGYQLTLMEEGPDA